MRRVPSAMLIRRWPRPVLPATRRKRSESTRYANFKRLTPQGKKRRTRTAAAEAPGNARRLFDDLMREEAEDEANAEGAAGEGDLRAEQDDLAEGGWIAGPLQVAAAAQAILCAVRSPPRAAVPSAFLRLPCPASSARCAQSRGRRRGWPGPAATGARAPCVLSLASLRCGRSRSFPAAAGQRAGEGERPPGPRARRRGLRIAHSRQRGAQQQAPGCSSSPNPPRRPALGSSSDCAALSVR